MASFTIQPLSNSSSNTSASNKIDVQGVILIVGNNIVSNTNPLPVSGGSSSGGSGGSVTIVSPLGNNPKANSVSITLATDLLGQTTMANSLPVVIASNQTAIPVTGTFWQNTQPVSINANVNVNVVNSVSVPVTGIFWQNTQPVSLSSNVNVNIVNTVALPVTGTFWQNTQPVSIAANVNVLLLPGTSIAGKFGIDQTTPNVTNRVSTGASLGTDNSANQPALPNVGSNFAASGPYASYVLIKTISVNNSRVNIDIENISGDQIVVIRDDGTAASGAAPVNASVFSISGGTSPGAAGGSWASKTFLGRLQIYAPSSTAIVTVMQD